MKESLRQERAYRFLYRLGLCEAKKCFATASKLLFFCSSNSHLKAVLGAGPAQSTAQATADFAPNVTAFHVGNVF